MDPDQRGLTRGQIRPAADAGRSRRVGGGAGCDQPDIDPVEDAYQQARQLDCLACLGHVVVFDLPVTGFASKESPKRSKC